MKKTVIALVTSAFLFAAGSAIAQTGPLPLPVVKESPTIDGTVGASEYSVGAEVRQVKLWLSRTADTVYAAISAQTTGWVALGFGSQRMDGALMVVGFVDSKGGTQLKVQKGSGRTHGDIESDALVTFAMKEAGGVTTMELALKASSLIGTGATELPVIYAMGGADNFASMHRARGSQPVKLQ